MDDEYDYRQQLDEDRRRSEEDRLFGIEWRKAWNRWANQDNEKELEHG